jgi:hypothetical protein
MGLKRALTILGRYLLGTLCVLLMGLLLSPFLRPTGAVGWVLLAPVLIVLYVSAEVAFEGVFTDKFGKRVSARRFSLLRIAVALLLVLPVFAASVLFSLILGAK